MSRFPSDLEVNTNIGSADDSLQDINLVNGVANTRYRIWAWSIAHTFDSIWRNSLIEFRLYATVDLTVFDAMTIHSQSSSLPPRIYPGGIPWIDNDGVQVSFQASGAGPFPFQTFVYFTSDDIP